MFEVLAEAEYIGLYIRNRLRQDYALKVCGTVERLTYQLSQPREELQLVEGGDGGVALEVDSDARHGRGLVIAELAVLVGVPVVHADGLDGGIGKLDVANQRLVDDGVGGGFLLELQPVLIRVLLVIELRGDVDIVLEDFERLAGQHIDVHLHVRSELVPWDCGLGSSFWDVVIVDASIVPHHKYAVFAAPMSHEIEGGIGFRFSPIDIDVREHI